MCGYCEEVCPEQAIFMTGNYEIIGTSRQEMVYDKERLLKLGGVHHDRIKKWEHAAGAPGVQLSCTAPPTHDVSPVAPQAPVPHSVSTGA